MSDAIRSSRPDIFFIVGHAKSGTSWLMRLLNAHPEILCKGEGRIVARDYRRDDLLEDGASPYQPISLYRALLEANYLNAWIERSVWTRDEDREEQVRRLARAAAELFLTQRLAGTCKRIVGDKTPFLGADDISDIAELFPDARVIHILRDGRDVAVSGIHHLWTREVDLGGGRDLTRSEARMRDRYRADPAGTVAAGESIFEPSRLREMATGWSNRVHTALTNGPDAFGRQYTEVRYEELLESTSREVCRLAAFLGADRDPQVARRCTTLASFRRWTNGRVRGLEDSTALLRKGIVGDWRRVFTEDDRRIFAEHAGELLVDLGYERDHAWARAAQQAAAR